MEYVGFYALLAMIIPLALNIKTRNGIHFLGYKWNIPIIMGFTIVLVTRAFAYDTGADYLVYYENYLYHGNTAWGENREIGFKFLNSFLHIFSDSPQLFFGFAAFVYMYAILKVSQLYGKADKWIVFFWSVILFVLSYNLYRQYFSLSFLLLGYYWLIQGHFIKSVLYGILAVLFHTSAVVGIVIIVGLYLLRTKTINKYYLMAAVILTSILSITILSSFLESFNFISELYLQATEKSYTADEMLDNMYDKSILTYPAMLAYLILIWYGDKIVKEHSDYRFIFYLFSFAVIITPLTNQEILMRIRLYIDAFIPLTLGLLAYRYKIKHHPMLWLALFFLTARFVYGLYNLGNAFPLQFKF